jgi:hypothetical protein
VDAVTPLGFNALLVISAVVSPLASPLTVKPLIVLKVPSNAVETDSPVTVALDL